MGDIYNKALGVTKQVSHEDIALAATQRHESSMEDVMGAAFSDQQTIPALERAYDRNFTEFPKDDSFVLDDEKKDAISQRYGMDSVKFFSDVKSEKEMNFVAQNIETDINRKNIISDAGWSGVGMSLIAGIADPVGWGLGMVTEGAGLVQKFSGLARVGALALSVGAENAALESALYAGDTQKDIDDIFLAFSFGSVMGGAIGAIKTPKARINNSIDDLTSEYSSAAMVNDTNKATNEYGTAGAQKVDFSQHAEVDLYDTTEKMKKKISDLSEKGDKHNQEIVDKERKSNIKIAPDILSSTFTTIINSDNPAYVGLAKELLENSQGNGFAERTVSMLSYINNNVLRGSGRGHYNKAWEMLLKENKLGVSAYLKPSIQANFNRDIYNYVVDKASRSSAPESVKLAGDAHIRQMETARVLNKEAGVLGFDKIKADDTYIPVIFDSTSIQKVASKKSGKEFVISAIARGYETGKRTVAPELADILARIQVERSLDNTLSGKRAFGKVADDSQIAHFVEEMEAAGIEKDTIRNFLNTNDAELEAMSMSDRAKHSLGFNQTATYQGTHVQDFLNTNVTELGDNYIKESSGNAALSRIGYSSKAQLESVILAAEKRGQELKLDPDRLRKEATMLRESVDLIFGRSIDADPNSSFNVGLRRAKDYTSIIRLQNLGFAQVPEMGRLMQEFGTLQILSDLKMEGIFHRGNKGRDAFGVITEPVLREMEESLNMHFEDSHLDAWSSRHDDFGENEATMSKIGAMADRVLAMGGRINSVMSGFRQVQGSYERIVMRNLNKRLKVHLSGGKKLNKMMQKEAGWSDEFLSEVKDYYKANPKHVQYNGRRVRLMNFDNMPYDMKELIGIGLHRASGRIIQKNFVGETSTWMNKAIGGAMTQFKSFSIVSAEKQLLHDLRGEKTAMVQRMALSGLIAYMTYATQSALYALGSSDSNYFSDKMKTSQVIQGVTGKMPQLAVASLVGEPLAGMGFMPDSLVQGAYGSGEAGFKPTNKISDLVPVVGMVEDAMSTSKMIMDYAMGDDNISTRQVVDKVRRMVPVIDTTATMKLASMAINQLED